MPSDIKRTSAVLPQITNKYYNVIQTAACEAVEECMGVPTDATVVTAEAFSGLSLVIETRWGLTPPITPNRGFIQSSVSGSEQAKPAQSPILALRAVSKVFYLTYKGRKVHAATTRNIMGKVHWTSVLSFWNFRSEALRPV